MNQEIRNKLRNVVTHCRKLLEDSVSQELEGKYGIFAKKEQVTADPNAKMPHLTEEEQVARKDILDHFGHVKARGFKPKEALDQLVREIAFTHLNRLCAYKMMEAREVYVGGQKFREAVSRGINSNGVKFYLADHPDEERLFNTGNQDVVYRHFLDWLGGLLSDEIGVLFNPNDPANRLYPRQKTLDEVLDLLNGGGIKLEEAELREEWPKIWSQDETIGWVYQYFTPKELRDQARKESAAPRNSYELAFRNQFFTPRYVVEFLTDNTLGRIWFEMRKGDTKLKDKCQYLVRRPTEHFLKDEEQPPKNAAERRDDLSQEELLKLPVYIPHRPKKDPRELRILDPASGSGHFLLYCFDLLATIYDEAYADTELGPALQKDYPNLEDLQRDVPRLILAHNLHGIDIDLRASQIAALALWLRCQRAYQDMGLKKDRPKITRSNFVCAEPMPGEEHMLKDFVAQLEPKLLGQVVEVVFDKMKLAGEAGALLKIEEEISDTVTSAKEQWVRETTRATDRKGQPLLFTKATMDRLIGKPEQSSLFDLSDITDGQFFDVAEAQVVEALRQYARKTQNGQQLQRRLFTDDAERGFAFVDLCHKRFDVVLMNPPFGSAVKRTSTYLADSYGPASIDLSTAFVSRMLSLSTPKGLVGAISTRTAFYSTDYEDYRRQTLRELSLIECVADLGYGVLDAVVETAAYTLSPTNSRHHSIFLTVLSERQKQDVLKQAIERFVTGHLDRANSFVADAHSFAQIPTLPLAYWLPRSFLALFRQFKSASDQGIVVKQGLATGDDFRFLRTQWEVPESEIGQESKWLYYAKGGEYSPVIEDLHLLVFWEDNGHDIIHFEDEKGNERSRPRGADFYLRPGATYSMRTTSSFSPRLMPAGCIFSVPGHAVFAEPLSDVLSYVGTAYTRVFRELLDVTLGGGDVSVAGSAARCYYPTVLHNLPLPSPAAMGDVAERVLDWWRIVYRETSTEEANGLFASLQLGKASSLRSAAVSARNRSLEAYCDVLQIHAEIEANVESAFRLSADDLAYLDQNQGPKLLSLPACTKDTKAKAHKYWNMTEEAVVEDGGQSLGFSRFVTKKNFVASRRLEVLSLLLNCNPLELASIVKEFECRNDELEGLSKSTISVALGCLFGRFDVRLALVANECTSAPDPFSALPKCSPAMLSGGDGLPLTSTPSGYPLRIEWEGIVVDDSENERDVVQGVRRVLESVWEQRADAIETEACAILGLTGLRDYFRMSGKNGFWDDHVAHYTKSRRKAPIYWLLQSAKKNYALWLYYHRLDKDLLFKAVVNYVEPKIRMETSRLETIRSHKAIAGDSGKEAKRLAKEVERQEDLLSELRDFEDKLRRAANLHLVPDLNDGVVLNIAPLWELVPWKEAKNYWEELLKGEYEWSSIGKQLRQKGLVK